MDFGRGFAEDIVNNDWIQNLKERGGIYQLCPVLLFFCQSMSFKTSWRFALVLVFAFYFIACFHKLFSPLPGYTLLRENKTHWYSSKLRKAGYRRKSKQLEILHL